ncbi:MAG: tetratricopeptide repeat protein [Candidatus Sulfotelmatobacter sp.]|jgi:tetratricopeptide (TPR) repeat protein
MTIKLHHWRGKTAAAASKASVHRMVASKTGGTLVVLRRTKDRAILGSLAFPPSQEYFSVIQGIFSIMAAHGEPLGAKKRLDSWKEIAAFFGRDERTVKRWEKERRLPVYRVPGSARGSVFAYAEELAEWLKAPNDALDAAESAAAEAVSAEEDSGREVAGKVLPIKVQVDSPVPSLAPALHLVRPPARLAWARKFLWLAPVALVAGSFLVLSFSHREPRFKNALAAPQPPNAEAQDLYLKGRYYFEKRTPADLNTAVDFFTQAIVHDPGYAAPYVGMADSYNLLREYSAMPPQEAFPRARAAASKAVELDPNSAEAHTSLAFASFWGFFDAPTADREFERAIELDPNLPRAHHWYATFLIDIGRNQEALAEIERARRLDPSSTPILADKGFILAEAGKKEEARKLLTQLTASQPDFVPSHRYLGQEIYFKEGDYTGYFEEMGTVARLRKDTKAEKDIAAEKNSYASSGVRGLLEERLTAAQESFEHGSGSAFELAQAYAALGRSTEAMKYLKIAYQRHDLLLTTLTATKEFQPMHQDAEFRDLVAKIGLPPVQ